ncbi:TPA: hypothetical protein I7730_16075 [Vibrio vulnificus]|uniref:Uncharacterized protein n=1 Tax=Vibrio vulnificus TaxID=672 RepID=A0A8H9TGB6_VIBVL|nr:hypothetical protein [Vibrio vulnificus]HAS8541301.1 hypothetical protein [Vibrio vulnificus]
MNTIDLKKGESPIEFQNRCYEAFLETVDFSDHVESILNEASFTFECPLTGLQLERTNNWDGTTSPAMPTF